LIHLRNLASIIILKRRNSGLTIFLDYRVKEN
jgi:hypothetical protein